jgi:hypothetical protein
MYARPIRISRGVISAARSCSFPDCTRRNHRTIGASDREPRHFGRAVHTSSALPSRSRFALSIASASSSHSSLRRTGKATSAQKVHFSFQHALPPCHWRLENLARAVQFAEATNLSRFWRAGPLFLHTRQSRTALPQGQSSAVVQRRRRRRSGMTLVEVFSGHIGHLWRRREIDDRLSAFGGGYGKILGKPSHARD